MIRGDDGSEDDLQRFETPEEAFQYLRYIGTQQNDAEIDLAEGALALGLIFLPGLHVDRYRQHLKKISDHAAEEFHSRIRLKEKDTAALRAQVLRKIIHEAHGYRGDDSTYDDIQNTNFIRVIERRKGLPIALGIIYIVLARRQGWQMDGLVFPGHFLIRLESDGERIILDPFKEGKEMDAAALRQLLKSIVGKGAELSHNYYNAATNRDVLIRLANNAKKRLIEGEDYPQALLVTKAMEAIAPGEYRTLFDKAILYAKLKQNQQAVVALEEYIEKTPNPAERRQAQILLQQIRDS